ncbi:hypothetical protein BR93DRAFT_235800 [Coniochaeta sp. PMI_546]|nr:hypothetical protein BR93DRAFT_235800 [Coniochaeta sp. PMI_546]
MQPPNGCNLCLWFLVCRCCNPKLVASPCGLTHQTPGSSISCSSQSDLIIAIHLPHSVMAVPLTPLHLKVSSKANCLSCKLGSKHQARREDTSPSV